MFSLRITLLTFVPLISAASSSSGFLGPRPGQIKNILTFGDSYTDVVSPGDNGTAWPIYAARDGNFTLFPFAIHGAACSDKLVHNQLPIYLEGVRNGTIRLDPEETIATLWIGTNDIGVSGLLTGKKPNTTVVDTTQCALDFFKTLYENGVRNFLFQNMIPLQHTIQYSPNAYPNRYWTLERNATMWSDMITEMVDAGNALSRLLLQFLAPTLHGAHVGLFDSYALFSEMLARPQDFLNGTAPLNTTGAIHACVFDLGQDPLSLGRCTDATGTDRDSFLWYDELHPSEQADRQVAKAVAAAIDRRTDRFTTWFS